MARKVFFSFHYDRDSWRVSQVRNSDVVKNKYEKNRFLDKADWEAVKKGGDPEIKKWIDGQMSGTSVTVVLIGQETSNRKFVLYEIEKSYEKGNGLLGIYIHSIKNQNGYTDYMGSNPFDSVKNNDGIRLSNFVRTYDWNDDNGRENLDKWIENAYENAGTY